MRTFDFQMHKKRRRSVRTEIQVRVLQEILFIITKKITVANNIESL